MSKPLSRFILSPCGTSSITNNAPNDLRSLIFQYANATTEEDIPEPERLRLKEHLEKRRTELQNADTKEVARLSAELNTLSKLYEGNISLSQGERADHHCLLSTDTWLGRRCAENIAGWLESRGFSVETFSVGGLRTDNLQNFQTAMADLVRWCEKTLPGYRKSGYQILFNLTGGFKSIQGFLQALAMFYADESLYIFETGQELLRLPRLPVRLDLEEHIREHLTEFRNLHIRGSLPESECQGIAETLLLSIDGECAFSAWGQLVWEESKKSLYQKELFPSPIPQIEFGPKFEKSTQGIAADRMMMVNERIDDLARYLLSNKQQPIRRLDYKRLQGNPKPPATHEMDAWADQDARRILCKEEDERVILLELAPHL